jgi:predicted Zn-dependent protease with MMP-like domain
MTRERFEEVAQAAFDSLPKEFREKVENVHIVVEDFPADGEHGSGGRDSLLGLYQGVPLSHRGSWYGAAPVVPDKITLYQKNIESVCGTESEIEHRIREVLFHELGHYFGMNERQVRQAMKNFQ